MAQNRSSAGCVAHQSEGVMPSPTGTAGLTVSPGHCSSVLSLSDPQILTCDSPAPNAAQAVARPLPGSCGF